MSMLSNSVACCSCNFQFFIAIRNSSQVQGKLRVIGNFRRKSATNQYFNICTYYCIYKNAIIYTYMFINLNVCVCVGARTICKKPRFMFIVNLILIRTSFSLTHSLSRSLKKSLKNFELKTSKLSTISLYLNYHRMNTDEHEQSTLQLLTLNISVHVNKKKP